MNRYQVHIIRPKTFPQIQRPTISIKIHTNNFQQLNRILTTIYRVQIDQVSLVRFGKILIRKKPLHILITRRSSAFMKDKIFSKLFI